MNIPGFIPFDPRFIRCSMDCSLEEGYRFIPSQIPVQSLQAFRDQASNKSQKGIVKSTLPRTERKKAFQFGYAFLHCLNRLVLLSVCKL